MIFSIVFSKQAEDDLKGIFEYISISLQAIENAIGQLDRLEKSILGLQEMPKRFPQYKREPWKSRGLRMMPVDNYIVYYIPNEVTQTITIVRVMYAGRNITEQLEK